MTKGQHISSVRQAVALIRAKEELYALELRVEHLKKYITQNEGVN